VLEHEPEPEPEPEPEAEPEPEPEPAPRLERLPEPAAEVRPAPVPVPAPAVERAPEPVAAPERPAAPAARLEDIREGMTLTVDELDALFRADTTGVNSRLANKTLLVKGTVSKIFIRDHIDVRYILLIGSSSKMLWSVRCVFGAKELPQMSRLSEGETATMRGQYDGFSKNIILKDCVLV
jgi:hypothetical protein